MGFRAQRRLEAVRRGSRHPNEDVSTSLGISAGAVRDRVHQARITHPPLLTGGGKRVVIGRSELTPGAVRVSRERLRPVLAALGQLTGDTAITRIGALLDHLLEEQARRVPGFWSMTLEELDERYGAPEPGDDAVDHTDPPGADG